MLGVGGILGTASAWISIFAPAYTFGESADIFSRLRPLLIASSLLVAELCIAVWLSRKTDALKDWRRSRHTAGSRAFFFAFVTLLATWLLMLITRFGIEKSSAFWNPPGVPLTGLQGVGVVCVLCLGALFVTRAPHDTALGSRRVRVWLLPIAIYVCAAVVWGLAPMQRHYFSLRPSAPSFEPFPFSDARTNDLGALSITNGQGIFFHDLTDKPLYMVFLAFLHLLGGDNYVWLIWLQVAALASIPVMLFMLGKQFHSEAAWRGSWL